MISATSITAIPPPSTAGTINVTVLTSFGTSPLTSVDRYSFIAATSPAITSISTSGGTTAGGNVVGITGTGFSGASSVLFGNVPATQFIIESDTTIAAVDPAQDAGSVDVSVVTPTGTSALTYADLFTYSAASGPAVTSLSITSGTTAGGVTDTIFGSGFTGMTGVSFGSVPATDVLFLSDNTVVATAPSQAAGVVDVTVTTTAGTSSTSSADEFTYTSATAPSVTGVTPGSGTAIGGGTVVITGSNLTGATTVSFGAVATTNFQVLNANTIEATAPRGVAATVNVTVTTPSGTSTTSSADEFTYTTPSVPTVTALAPAREPRPAARRSCLPAPGCLMSTRSTSATFRCSTSSSTATPS